MRMSKCRISDRHCLDDGVLEVGHGGSNQPRPATRESPGGRHLRGRPWVMGVASGPTATSTADIHRHARRSRTRGPLPGNGTANPPASDRAPCLLTVGQAAGGFGRGTIPLR